ncbi:MULTISPECIES: hypothetical protein [Frankia]|uniref:Peptide zinc metalloprotease protein n=1 Tax=Frankia alni (strain DSM 45986 / CECT 9034 / ACN14a) TaxID=326424 RepID=Q0RGL6_FRAAA|nr:MULTISPECIES: hypothetical protein [Frankia]CAJ63371.1 hypothetical protein; putative membrane protein [Frankia alni ACN14a]
MTDIRPGPTPGTVPARPCRADGLALLGEFADSGLDRPVQLARRSDGQVVALTELLAHILAAADGTRDIEAIAGQVAVRNGRAVSGADVGYLIADRLMPLGLIAAAEGATPTPRAAAMFTLAARRTLLPAPVVARLGGVLAVLFRPAVIAGLLALLVVADIWVFRRHSVADSAAAVLATPTLMLAVVGLALAGALVHESGHAAACRYGGAGPGVIGFGMYLVWPAFFTDVTDSYRLSRRGRLRTDLGGIYFNGLYALALCGALAVSHAEVLVTAIVLAHLDAARQLAPFVRLDGYYIMGDLAGVPDLFSRMVPALRSALPGRRRPPSPGEPAGGSATPAAGAGDAGWVGGAGPAGPGGGARLTGLTRRARLVVTAWALLAAPAILVNLVLLLVSVPFVVPRTARAVWAQLAPAGSALGGGQVLTAVADAAAAVVLALPAAGMLFVLFLLGRAVTRGLAAHHHRKRSHRECHHPERHHRGRDRRARSVRHHGVGGSGGRRRGTEPATPPPQARRHQRTERRWRRRPIRSGRGCRSPDPADR